MSVRIKAELFKLCTTRNDLADLLGVRSSTLTYLAFSKGKKYKTFEIPKKGGGIRKITSPSGALKTIQRKLAAILNEIYPKPAYVLGFVEDGSILKNAVPHVGKRVVLNFDLKDFFPSITATRVIGLFRAEPFKFNNEVVSTLAGLLCHNGSLPQGAPTSPIVSNIISFRLDKQLCALSKREHISYTRYADDLTFSTSRRRLPLSVLKRNEEGSPCELGDEISKIVSSNYFEINHSKTRVSFGSKPKYVTGVKVNLKPNTSKKFTRQVRAMIHAWEAHGLDNARREFASKYGGGNRDFVNVVRGKLAHIKNVKGDADLVYRRLNNRFATLEGTGRPILPITEIEELYEKIYIVKSGAEIGTAFILDEKFLITCSHTVVQADVEYFTHSEYMPPLVRHTRAQEQWRSESFDVIALPPQARDTNNPARSLYSAPSDEDVSVGRTYSVLGFPNYFTGSQPHFMKVNVTNLSRDRAHNILNAFVDKKLISGSSGSPVLNERNQVVGIVLRGTLDRTTGDDWTGYVFLPIQELRRCFRELGLTTV